MKKKTAAALKRRPPVVVVVGHIDHGKSTLLDYIRQTKLVESEPGGITQRVSAYEVKHKRENGVEETITFLDTPGHEAFSGIRERSVLIADLAIVVVSAEEGVKAQTIEALRAVEGGGLPYLIAINKIDRLTADINQTKQGLAESGILVEGYGGTIPCLPISAKTGEGIPELLELILLMADLAELTVEPNVPTTTLAMGEPAKGLAPTGNLGGLARGPAEGFVLEATRHPKIGIVTTLIVKNGCLRLGDFLVVENIVGRIKKLKNFHGENVAALEASSPAVVLGLPQMPSPGTPFITANDKRVAETLAAKSEGETQINTADRMSETEGLAPTGNLGGLASGPAEGVTLFPLILKADNQGSLEAMQKEVNKLNTETAKFLIIGSGVGQITENDVKLGTGTRPAVIVGFNIRAERNVALIAEKYGIVIKTFDIIYHLSEWLTEEIIRHTPVAETEEIIGEIRVLKIFSHVKNRQIIGGAITQGSAALRHRVKIVRRGASLGEGEIIELKQQKLSVKKIETGEQFGALVESKITIAPNDTLLIFTRDKR